MFFPEDRPFLEELRVDAKDALRENLDVCDVCGEKLEEFVRMGQVIKRYCPNWSLHPPLKANDANAILMT